MALKPQLSAQENLKFFARLYGGQSDVDAALRMGGLSRARRFPGAISFRRSEEAPRAGAAEIERSRRSGCWMSRSRRWIASGKKLAEQMLAAHCASGGIVIAATHEAAGVSVATAIECWHDRALLFRDIRLATRAGGSAMLALAFFASVAALVPLGVGSDLNLLARIAGGVLWIAAILAALLSLDRLFQSDFEDGSLDLIALSPLSLEATAFAKIAAHWLTTGLPLTMLSPVLGLLFGLPPQALCGAGAFACHRHARGQRHRRHRRGAHAFHPPRRVDPAADRAAAAGARRDFRRGRGAGGARRACPTARSGCWRRFRCRRCCLRPLPAPPPCGSISQDERDACRARAKA